MRICISCEDVNVESVRNAALTITKFDGLKIPLSETGEEPATHWFCYLNVTPEGYEKILARQDKSIIEESSPKEFLNKWNLKIIKKESK